jgi:type II secretory pathway pseudopilin PulG
MNKSGQVWIETVTYTLVAFIMIGLVLSFAKPKVEELQDQAIIEQSINLMKNLDLTIREVAEMGQGNKRKVEINLKKGNLEIDSISDSVLFTFEGNYMYSQPGQNYSDGNLKILTEEKGTKYNVTLELQYPNLNITYLGDDQKKKLTGSGTPYVIFISNKGGQNPVVDFEIN